MERVGMAETVAMVAMAVPSQRDLLQMAERVERVGMVETAATAVGHQRRCLCMKNGHPTHWFSSKLRQRKAVQAEWQAWVKRL